MKWNLGFSLKKPTKPTNIKPENTEQSHCWEHTEHTGNFLNPVT